MPFTITQDVEGQELVMNISEYIFNKDVSDSDFE
jgi:outer membrane lipoprotein-sorting protein